MEGGFMKRILLFTFAVTLLLVSRQAQAISEVGRLGVGVSEQFVTGKPAISIKLLKSRSFAVGALLQMKLDDTNGSTGAGLKLYRNIFIEPNLNFYSSVMAAYLKSKTTGRNDTGWQVDLSLGSEFSFTGLQSLGLSFEFGVSLHKLTDDLIIETLGNHIVKAAIHFYI
jgi:hypothetical protein